jgi:GNAT superfamily N-acetyltransferase
VTDTPGVRLRPALAQDADFLADMLLAAFDWTGEGRFTPEQVRTDPAIAHYVAGWPRPGDFGVIATDAATGERAGAAWARLFPADDPGDGFVAPDVPEVVVAVAPPWRGRGVGRTLLRTLIGQAAGAGVARLSLNVEDGNPAVRLYTSLGFEPVERADGSDTLLLNVPPPPGR